MANYSQYTPTREDFERMVDYYEATIMPNLVSDNKGEIFSSVCTLIEYGELLSRSFCSLDDTKINAAMSIINLSAKLKDWWKLAINSQENMNSQARSIAIQFRPCLEVFLSK